jgi:DNA-directed RNA polymerase
MTVTKLRDDIESSLDDVDVSLVKEQMSLEMGMRDAGRIRFRKQLTTAMSGNAQDNTPYGSKVISLYIEPVAIALEKWIVNGKGKAGARRIAEPYLESVPYSVSAMLGLKAIFERLLTERAMLSSTAIHIGRMIEDEVRCTELRRIDRVAYNAIMKKAAEKGEYKRKVSVVKFLAKQDNNEWSAWAEKACMHIGMVVIDAVQDCVSLIEFYERPLGGGNKTAIFMRPTQDTKQAVSVIVEEALRDCSPTLEPTVIPPKPWIAGEMNGGYWTDYIQRRPFAKVRNKNYLELLKYSDMPKVLGAVNATQETRWRVNARVLYLLQELMERNSELGGTPRAELLPIPKKPLDIDTNEEARKAYRLAARGVYEENVRITGKRLSYLQTIDTASRYVNYRAIYMPHTVDFRSRVYPQPSLNPQGADYTKALLEFADGIALGEEGLRWLKIHVANLFGVDKVSYNDRVKWCDDNREMLTAISVNPYENRQWCEADKPFQAYTAASDLSEAYHCADPTKHLSHTPIAMDGSCSGIQNLSLAFRDEVGGAYVNLLPTDVPADIYKAVADKTITQLEVDAKLEPITESDIEPSHATGAVSDGTKPDEVKKEKTSTHLLAKWWLEFGISRSVTKRNCMTFPYGSKQRGFSDQILEDHLRPFVKDKANANSPLLKTNERGALEPIYPMMELSNYLAKLNYNSVQNIVVKAAEAMDWMQACARIVAAEGRPVTWTTPLGFPVVQNYRKTKDERVETHLAGARKVLSMRRDLPDVDKRKSSLAISPNVVHSLDASHLMLTVWNAVEAGIKNFALIHDSFGTHAGNTAEFYCIIRSSFIELYADGYFHQLREQFMKQIPEDKRHLIPPLPSEGNLNPDSVLESPYCFA